MPKLKTQNCSTNLVLHTLVLSSSIFKSNSTNQNHNQQYCSFSLNHLSLSLSLVYIKRWILRLISTWLLPATTFHRFNFNKTDSLLWDSDEDEPSSLYMTLRSVCVISSCIVKHRVSCLERNNYCQNCLNHFHRRNVNIVITIIKYTRHLIAFQTEPPRGLHLNARCAPPSHNHTHTHTKAHRCVCSTYECQHTLKVTSRDDSPLALDSCHHSNGFQYLWNIENSERFLLSVLFKRFECWQFARKCYTISHWNHPPCSPPTSPLI